jgi:molecular chaperone GrpE
MQQTENNWDGELPEEEREGRETDIKAENQDISDEKTGQPGEAATDQTPAGAEKRYDELNDKYLRLYSDFDNYRKRSMRERADLMRTAGEEIFRAILPVIDDLERAIKAAESTQDNSPLKEGMKLIYNKLRNTVQQKGLVAFDSAGEPFNADTMEAITHIEATDEGQKGKVVDEVEKGYKLGDKVIRYAKVVVAR